MGQNISKEESAIVRLLLHILSKRGVKYDEHSLRRLLIWCREHGFPLEPQSAFKVDTWEAIGKVLWEAVSNGEKDTKGLATAWRVVLTALQNMKAEHSAAVGAFAALGPSTLEAFPAGIRVFGQLPAPSLSAPSAPSAEEEEEEMEAEKATEPGKAEEAEKVEMEVDEPWPEPRPEPPPSPKPPRQSSYVYPPLPPSTPPSPAAPVELSERHRDPGWAEKLLKKLEELEREKILLERQRQEEVDALNRLQNNIEGRRLDGGGAGGEHVNYDGDPWLRWRGVIQNALVEGEILPTAFPVILGGPKKTNQWVSFQWEIIKEARKTLQARLNVEILQQSATLAREALRTLPEDGKVMPSYTKVKQEPNESYMQFFERLRLTLEKALLTDVAREALLMTLAVDNANPTCKCILQGLTKNSSIVKMMDACARVGTAEETAGYMASAFAAAVKLLTRQGKGDRGPKCYNCGKPGHIKAQCRLAKQKGGRNSGNGGSGGSFAGTCNRCQKYGHRANECRSKFNKDGIPLGNGDASAKRPSAMTQNGSSVHAAWMASPPPQQEVPEWTWPQQYKQH
ncbi:endogenous retrovirus group K member 7 Gag polyprotein-like [Nyctibius grandis]|uniref:endogenous retrovirus group K member 7 Gag polyprotein-like n=1 Tax=Nyctibius grandis TaxID=48427 RepID=UPI0035BC10EB